MFDKILKFNHNGWCEDLSKSYQKGYYRPADQTEYDALVGFAAEVIDLSGQEIKIIRKPLRPVSVGLESEKPEELYEGEGFFATDTYRMYFGGKNNKNPFGALGFPYYMLTQDPGGTDIFLFFVDPVEGDDNNSGAKWSQAKKTLWNVLNLLPQDLNGYAVRIYIQGGVEERDQWNFYFRNGKILIYWAGTFFNTSTSDWADFRRSGEVAPIRNNDPFVMKGIDDTKAPFRIHGEDNFELGFFAINEDVAHWQSGHCCYDKIIFEDVDSETVNVHGGLCAFNSDTLHLRGVGFKPKGCNEYVLYSHAQKGGIAGIRLHDTALPDNEPVHKANDKWRGVFMLNGNHSTDRIAFGKISSNTGAYIRYHPDFAPPNWDGGATQTIVIDGEVATLLSFNDPAKSVWVDIDANDLTLNGVGDNPAIKVDVLFEGTIQYKSTQLTLVDNSTKSRSIKDYATGVEKIYLTNGILQNGSDVVFALPTSDPAKAGALWNDGGAVKVSAGT